MAMTLTATCVRCGCALTVVFDFVGRVVTQECRGCSPPKEKH